MSEQNERKLEGGATAENGAKDAREARENAPRGAERKPPKKKGKKRRRRGGVALPLMAVLVVAALVCGMAAGYGIGRSASNDRLRRAEAEVSRLTLALSETEGGEQADTAADAENQAALEALATGLPEPEDGNGMLAGDEALDGEAGDASAGEAVVVVEYDGGTLMSDEVAEAYNERVASYLFSGYSEEEIAGTVVNEAMRELVTERILEDRAREMGVYEPSDADQAQIEAAAQARYDEDLDYYRSLARAEGVAEAQVQQEAEARLLEAEGVGYADVLEETRANWWRQKLYDEVTKDVRVEDEELQAAYDEKLAEQKESFDAYPEDFEYAQMNGEVIVYRLPGYRAVKLLRFELGDSETLDRAFELHAEMAGLDPDIDADVIDANQAELDGIYAAAEARAQDALAELQGGASFDELIEKYGSDEGMRDADIRAEGYYLNEATLNWPEEVVLAVMALENPGDVSAPLRLEDGVCVLQYVGEVAAGEVPLSDVRERLMEETLSAAREEAYEAQIDIWLSEANVRYYPERMQ